VAADTLAAVSSSSARPASLLCPAISHRQRRRHPRGGTTRSPLPLTVSAICSLQHRQRRCTARRVWRITGIDAAVTAPAPTRSCPRPRPRPHPSPPLCQVAPLSMAAVPGQVHLLHLVARRPSRCPRRPAQLPQRRTMHPRQLRVPTAPPAAVVATLLTSSDGCMYVCVCVCVSCCVLLLPRTSLSCRCRVVGVLLMSR
jgi:hypothetical protein